MRGFMGRDASVSAHPAGGKQDQPYPLSFNATLKGDFQGSRAPFNGLEKRQFFALEFYANRRKTMHSRTSLDHLRWKCSRIGDSSGRHFKTEFPIKLGHSIPTRID
jgi:hypothetical protein